MGCILCEDLDTRIFHEGHWRAERNLCCEIKLGVFIFQTIVLGSKVSGIWIPAHLICADDH